MLEGHSKAGKKLLSSSISFNLKTVGVGADFKLNISAFRKPDRLPCTYRDVLLLILHNTMQSESRI